MIKHLFIITLLCLSSTAYAGSWTQEDYDFCKDRGHRGHSFTSCLGGRVSKGGGGGKSSKPFIHKPSPKPTCGLFCKITGIGKKRYELYLYEEQQHERVRAMISCERDNDLLDAASGGSSVKLDCYELHYK